tara:strand:- start:3415 stop:3612 length:198 start_codon:yes stop_codon:yes gene_type:complete
MIIQNAELLTRYTVFYEGFTYMRVVEKSVDDFEHIYWVSVSEGTVYNLSEDEFERLEIEFLKNIE